MRDLKIRNELDEELENKQNEGGGEDSTRKPLVRKSFQKQITYNFQRQTELGDRHTARIYPELTGAERYNKRFTLAADKTPIKVWLLIKVKKSFLVIMNLL